MDGTGPRARAERARTRARALSAKALVLHARANVHVAHAAAEVGRAKALRLRLREVVSEHAKLSRRIGEPPEQTVVRIKEAATEAVALARTKAAAVDPFEAQHLRDQLVRWTLDAYFSDGPLSS